LNENCEVAFVSSLNGNRMTGTRTYEWADSAEIIAAAQTLTGLELLQAMGEGSLPGPPISATLGMTAVSVKHGEVSFALDPAEFHYNPLGSVHGGVFATLLDSVLGCAIHSTLDRAQGFTTLTLEIKYVRAATDRSGTLTATGKVVTRGRKIATAEGSVTDARGRLFATATTTCMIFPAPKTESQS
jgi:uncharacterized protein (TIGR00369 family)